MTAKKDLKLIVHQNSQQRATTTYTSQIPLSLCNSCCDTIRNLTELHSALLVASSSSTNKQDEGDEDEDDEEEQERKNRMEELLQAATGAGTSSSKNSNNNNNNKSYKNTSFFSELPSCLPLEIPSNVASDIETLKLFVEYHTGSQPFEICEVASWGTQHESSEIFNGPLMSSINARFHQQQQLQKQQRNMLAQQGNSMKRGGSSSKTKKRRSKDLLAQNSFYDDDEDNNYEQEVEQEGGNEQQQFLEEQQLNNNNNQFRYRPVDHSVLDPLMLPDRNPGVIFSSVKPRNSEGAGNNSNNNFAGNASSSSSAADASQQQQQQQQQHQPQSRNSSSSEKILPTWEKLWVQDNFLSLDAPACCTKAAKVAAFADFMSCLPLTRLMALVIASRLCERPNASTDNMRWCLSGSNAHVTMSSASSSSSMMVASTSY